MARQADTYQPSAENRALLERFFAGDMSVKDALNDALLRDPKLLTFFNKLKTQMNVRVGRGNSWSVGTNGSRVSGPNDAREIGNYTRSASAWNQNRNNRAGYSGAATSPGGFKASGRDDDSALRRSGTVSGDAVLSKVSINGDGSVTLGKRKFTKAQANAILNRGMSGATMNWADQAIYDRLIQYGADMDTVLGNRMEEMRRSARDPEAEKAKADEDERKRLLDETIKRENDYADWQRKKDYEARIARVNEAAKNAMTASENARKEALDRADKLIKAGSHKHTDSQNKRMTDLQQAIDDIMFDDSIDGDTKKRIIANMNDQIDAIYANPHRDLSPKETSQDSLDKRKVSFTLRDGQVVEGYADDKGNFHEVKAEKPDNSAERERIASENKKKDWIRKNLLEEERKFDNVSEKLDNDAPNPNYGKEFDKAAAYRRLNDIYDATETLGNAGRTTWESGDTTNLNPFDPLNPNNVTNLNYTATAPVKPVAPEPTPQNAASNWQTFFDVTPKQPVDQPLVEAPVSDLSPNDQVSLNACPECGAQMVNGVCPICGYPDENRVLAWRESHNGQEVQ